MTEPVRDADLQAYVDDQLDMAGRIEVERWLQHRPEAAAEVMESLRLRDEIKLFLAADDYRAAPATVALARQLHRQLNRRALTVQARRWVAAAVLVAAGWAAHAEWGLFVDEVAAAHPPPAVAEAAAATFAAMRRQVAAGRPPDAHPVALVARGTGELVPLPSLGEGLRRVGTATVPWAGGTAVVVLFHTAAGELVCLFAAEDGSFAVSSPETAPVHDPNTVLWQTGPFVYALTASLPETKLLELARHAAPRPWTGFEPTSSNEGATHG